MKRTGYHASNFAWRLQLGSFYVLATLSCALATASTVTPSSSTRMGSARRAGTPPAADLPGKESGDGIPL